MRFKSCIRNSYGKTDIPSNTIRRIRDGLQRMNLNVEYQPFRVSDDIHWGRVWIESIRIICNGKGVTPELAQASAYAELAERLCAGMFYPEFEKQIRFNLPAIYSRDIRRFLNYEWMPGYMHTHQDELESPLTIEELLVNETHLTAGDLREIRDSHMAAHWVDGFSLMSGKTVKIPVNFVSYIHGSNGMASGNTIEEAIIQAACEIFERHATIRIIKPEKTIPSIDPDSLENGLIRDMIKFYQNNNVDVTIKDLSLDGLLPCLGILFTNRNLRPDLVEHRILISGASFNTDEALTRCCTEAMQGRETLMTPRPQLDTRLVPRSRVRDFYLLMKCGISPKDISFLEKGETIPYSPMEIRDVLEEIEGIRNICRRLDTDCIILDHTHPLLKFPVVRVIIPGFSDFLPFLPHDILTSSSSKPATTPEGRAFRQVMESFFSA